MLFSAPFCRTEREKDKHKFLPPVLVGSSPLVLPTFPGSCQNPTLVMWEGTETVTETHIVNHSWTQKSQLDQT